MTTFKEAFEQMDKPLHAKTIKAAEERIGEVFYHPKYGEFTIIEYLSCEKVKIKFLSTGYEYYTSYSHIQRLEVFDAHHKGKYNNYRGGKNADKQIYKTWYNMLFRCNNLKGYKTAMVCEEWHEYSKFEEWYNRQYKETGWHLDKDILSYGVGIYSPNTCCFLPPEINTFFIKHKQAKGYSLNRKRAKYEAFCRDNGKKVHLGKFDSPIEARAAYVKYKRKLLERIITPYLDVISARVYKAMIEYIC